MQGRSEKLELESANWKIYGRFVLCLIHPAYRAI
jgi:hypothetical protein